MNEESFEYTYIYIIHKRYTYTWLVVAGRYGFRTSISLLFLGRKKIYIAKIELKSCD